MRMEGKLQQHLLATFHFLLDADIFSRAPPHFYLQHVQAQVCSYFAETAHGEMTATTTRFASFPILTEEHFFAKVTEEHINWTSWNREKFIYSQSNIPNAR
jgi:hypothetical protein